MKLDEKIKIYENTPYIITSDQLKFDIIKYAADLSEEKDHNLVIPRENMRSVLEALIDIELSEEEVQAILNALSVSHTTEDIEKIQSNQEIQTWIANIEKIPAFLIAPEHIELPEKEPNKTNEFYYAFPKDCEPSQLYWLTSVSQSRNINVEVEVTTDYATIIKTDVNIDYKIGSAEYVAKIQPVKTFDQMHAHYLMKMEKIKNTSKAQIVYFKLYDVQTHQYHDISKPWGTMTDPNAFRSDFGGILNLYMPFVDGKSPIKTQYGKLMKEKILNKMERDTDTNDPNMEAARVAIDNYATERGSTVKITHNQADLINDRSRNTIYMKNKNAGKVMVPANLIERIIEENPSVTRSIMNSLKVGKSIRLGTGNNRPACWTLNTEDVGSLIHAINKHQNKKQSQQMNNSVLSPIQIP